MKFSVFTASTPDWTPAEAAQTLAEQGWDGIEWRIVDDRPAEALSRWSVAPRGRAAAQSDQGVAVGPAVGALTGANLPHGPCPGRSAAPDRWAGGCGVRGRGAATCRTRRS